MIGTRSPFDTLFIANRGEIACRIIRTARRMGLRTVAAFTEDEQQAMHVRMADAAVRLDGNGNAATWLDIGAMIAAARAVGAGAVHPGYGFLSENPDFAQACADVGLVFVGPSAGSIRLMADKGAAKRAMATAGVPCIPGYDGEDQDDARLLAEADAIGYPVMIKAVMGGGGRGMRLVTQGASFLDALRVARSEASAAFGDVRVILEKAVADARHIEIQVFGDRHGHVIHLGERDCSIQRRHQKLIEESPSPAVDPKLRSKMGDTSVAAVKAVGYEGAGTLEFLLAPDGSFFFMEMNTRLQVEHPVTEAVTGLDLVELQLRIAAGEPLGLAQADVRFSGHAIEARLCAEDPFSDFLPQAGKLLSWRMPQGLRVDTAMETGAQVSASHDSMVAKLVSHAPTREEARRRLSAGLQESHVLGIRTNREYLSRVLAHCEFAEGKATTAFAVRNAPELTGPASDPSVPFVAAALERLPAAGLQSALPMPFAAPLRIMLDGRQVEALVTEGPYGRLEIAIGGTALAIEVLAYDGANVRLLLNGAESVAAMAKSGDDLWFDWRGGTHLATDRTFHPPETAGPGEGDGTLRALMQGRVVAIHCTAGDVTARGQPLVTVEAMKLQQVHVLPSGGTVADIRVREGDQVSVGQVLLLLEARN